MDGRKANAGRKYHSEDMLAAPTNTPLSIFVFSPHTCTIHDHESQATPPHRRRKQRDGAHDTIRHDTTRYDPLARGHEQPTRSATRSLRITIDQNALGRAHIGAAKAAETKPQEDGGTSTQRRILPTAETRAQRTTTARRNRQPKAGRQAGKGPLGHPPERRQAITTVFSFTFTRVFSFTFTLTHDTNKIHIHTHIQSYSYCVLCRASVAALFLCMYFCMHVLCVEAELSEHDTRNKHQPADTKRTARTEKKSKKNEKDRRMAFGPKAEART